MTKNKKRVQFYISKEDFERLNRRAKCSGMTINAYLSHLTSDTVPQDAPPTDYYGMMKELYGIRTAFEQIAYSARVHGVDASGYEEACLKLDSCIRDIVDTVRVPSRA